MSKIKYGNPKKQSEFICLKCLQKGIRGIQRGASMILYKNVDVKDLDSIFHNGILSLNESKNNNWDRNRRANNSCDLVYL